MGFCCFVSVPFFLLSPMYALVARHIVHKSDQLLI